MPDDLSQPPPRFPARVLLGLVWTYQHVVSTPLHLLCGGPCGCRFHPSCSRYAAEAIRVHGAGTGSFLSLKRLLKCGPWHPGGVDFVPPPHALRPTCVRARSSRAAT